MTNMFLYQTSSGVTRHRATLRRLRLETIVGSVLMVWLLGLGLLAIAPPIVAISATFSHITAVLAPLTGAGR